MNHLRAWFKAIDLLTVESVRRLGWVGSALLFLGLFLKVTWELHEDSALNSLDQRVLIFISKHRIPSLNGSAVDVTALGSATVITLLTIIGVILLSVNRDRRGSAYLAIGSIGAGVGTSLIKHLFTRPRPEVVPRLVEVDGFSYPSGHSLAATSFYLLLMFLAWRRYQAWQMRAATFFCATTLISGVCFSRLYLGVHYPSDVLSGLFLGTAWACLLTAYFYRTPTP